jgi:hypothetical protein
VSVITHHMPADTDAAERIAFVSALELPPGAVVVIKSERMLTALQARLITSQVHDAIPGHKVIVLSPGLDMDVVVPT